MYQLFFRTTNFTITVSITLYQKYDLLLGYSFFSATP